MYSRLFYHKTSFASLSYTLSQPQLDTDIRLIINFHFIFTTKIGELNGYYFFRYYCYRHFTP